MYLPKIKQRIGRYLGVGMVLLGIVMPIVGNVWLPTIASAATPSLRWRHVTSEGCLAPGSRNTADAVLDYTDSDGHPHTFHCYDIKDLGAIGGNGQDVFQMKLVMSLNDPCTTFTVGAVGLGDTSSYTVDQLGKFNASPSGSGCLPFPSTNPIHIDNNYLAAGSVGTASWSKVDPLNPVGVLTAKFILGNFKTETTEVFRESARSDTVMTLTGTLYGDKANCPNYVDTIQVGTVKTYWSDTTAVLSIGNASEDLRGGVNCNSPLTGTLTLTGTYIEAGGQDPNTVTTEGQGCVFDLNPLNFILCAAFNIVSFTTQQLNNNIQATLYVDTGQIFGNTSPFKAAYDSFRNIALTIIILAGLVMVASQAAGLEIFSALTVRKKLPAIVIAAIALSLAWPLMELAVTLSNDLGSFVQGIIFAAVSSVHGLNPVTTNQLLTDIFGTAAGSAALIGLGTAGLFSLGITVFISLFVAFVTLLLRQIIIVLCIMLAPLAIALSVLPGTEGLFKFWRTTFTGMLTMFPIIMGLLAAGDVVSRVAAAEAIQPGGGPVTNGWVFLLIAVIARFFPYLMLGAILSLSNRTIAGINQALTGTVKPFLDSEAKRRQGIQAQNWASFKAGSRFSDSRGATIASLGTNRLVNFIGGHAGAGIRGRFGFGGVGAAVRGANAQMSADEAGKTIPNFAKLTADAPTALAIAAGNDAAYLRGRGLDASGIAAGRGIQATQQVQVAAFEALAKTGKFEGSTRDAWELANRISRGNSTLRLNMLAGFAGASRASGRADLGRMDYNTGAQLAGRALSEMTADDVARQRPEHFSNPNSLFSDTNIRTAVTSAGSPQEAQHIADLVYGAAFSDKVQPAVRQRLYDLINNPAEPLYRYRDRAAENQRINKTGFGNPDNPPTP